MRVPSPNTSFFSAHPPPPSEEEQREKKRRKRGIKTNLTNHPNTKRPPMRDDQAANERREARAGHGGSPSIEWRDPPAARCGRARSIEIDAIVSELKNHTGCWARVIHAKPGNGQSVKPWKSRGCEFRIARRGDGKFDGYARWPEGVK